MHSYVMALMVVGASAVAVSGQAPAAPAKPTASVPAHILLTPGDIKWGPAQALPGVVVHLEGRHAHERVDRRDRRV